jgi:hypothetical protein
MTDPSVARCSTGAFDHGCGGSSRLAEQCKSTGSRDAKETARLHDIVAEFGTVAICGDLVLVFFIGADNG